MSRKVIALVVVLWFSVSTNVFAFRLAKLDWGEPKSRVEEKLKQKDLVSRTECGNDRRQVDVLITQTGIELLKKIARQAKPFENNLSRLTESEAKVLNRLLDKFHEQKTNRW